MRRGSGRVVLKGETAHKRPGASFLSFLPKPRTLKTGAQNLTTVFWKVHYRSINVTNIMRSVYIFRCELFFSDPPYFSLYLLSPEMFGQCPQSNCPTDQCETPNSQLESPLSKNHCFLRQWHSRRAKVS